MGDLGVHKADLLRYILGEEFVEVGAFVETTAKKNTDVDDSAACILRTESGIIGTLTASWSYAKKTMLRSFMRKKRYCALKTIRNTH